MTARLSLQTQQRQKQTLSPRLQHAVRLLQLSSLDFRQQILSLQGRNPFLDFEDECESSQSSSDASAGAAGPQSEADTSGDRDPWIGENYSNRRHEGGTDVSALDFVPGVSSLAGHLHFQLAMQRGIAPRELLLARALADSLDDDGYLRTPLSELAPLLQLDDEPASVDELERALQRLQSLEPAGVGARNVQECLRLQLQASDGPSELTPQLHELALRIVEEELPALARHELSGIARRLGRSATEVELVCQRIRRLDPHPGWRHGGVQTQYIVPDVLVRKRRGVWTVSLNDAILPRVSLNRRYAELAQRHAAGGGELAAHLQEARWTLRNIEQRFSTIASVAQAIVDRQRHFFDYGPMAMKPLGLREIAEQVGVHESTVSRVTSNKFMATPGGVYELKHFFSRAHISSNGRSCSPTAIRGLVQSLIEGESAEAPLSDAEIARQLQRQGLDVARRTVTKYRQALRYEPCDRRHKAAH
ncbi:RNA polymerase factor sigma-54 [Roseateles violae]|uniref:RNA polymerase sigma-54 factor n=1 Tax=Roseateles violae TaxID=3058042 RepID=A0ABT8DQN9_9BURK|nr:RNA polymerase factor sigma-54 [Pelomonas sp. PFR6]MDN3920666.1 RNA polymerase factor sigma-54 [Pelomonas sp. PFR6]